MVAADFIIFYLQRTKIIHMLRKFPSPPYHGIAAMGGPRYFINPTRRALATACVRLTVSSFLVARLR
jgi:hypothetical protein